MATGFVAVKVDGSTQNVERKKATKVIVRKTFLDIMGCRKHRSSYFRLIYHDLLYQQDALPCNRDFDDCRRIFVRISPRLSLESNIDFHFASNLVATDLLSTKLERIEKKFAQRRNPL